MDINRIKMFLPSIIALIIISILGLLVSKAIKHNFRNKIDNLVWRSKYGDKLKFALLFYNFVFRPAGLELVFRVPLLLMFGTIMNITWLGIFVSSILSGVWHSFFTKPSHGFQQWFIVLGKGEIRELSNLTQERDNKTKLIQLAIDFSIGIFLGYLCLKYQSIWVSFLAHSVLPAIMMVVAVLIVFLSRIATLIILGAMVSFAFVVDFIVDLTVIEGWQKLNLFDRFIDYILKKSK